MRRHTYSERLFNHFAIESMMKQINRFSDKLFWLVFQQAVNAANKICQCCNWKALIIGKAVLERTRTSSRLILNVKLFANNFNVFFLVSQKTYYCRLKSKEYEVCHCSQVVYGAGFIFCTGSQASPEFEPSHGAQWLATMDVDGDFEYGLQHPYLQCLGRLGPQHGSL